MGMEVSPQRQQGFTERAIARTVLGARRVSNVIVTRVDPAELQAAMHAKPAEYGKHVESTITELEPEFVAELEPYKHGEAMDIAGVAKRVTQRNPKKAPAKPRVQTEAQLSKAQRQVAEWNETHKQ